MSQVIRKTNATVLSYHHRTSQRGLNGWREPSRAYSIRRGPGVSLLLPTSMLSVPRRAILNDSQVLFGMSGRARWGLQGRCSSHRNQDPDASLMVAVTTSCRTSRGGTGLLLPVPPGLYGWGQERARSSRQHAVGRAENDQLNRWKSPGALRAC